MLVLPSSGFRRSSKSHNVDIPILCDWIEASVVFIDSIVSQTDIVDTLIENNVYSDQEYAYELLAFAWTELERRSRLLHEDPPFSLSGDTILRTYDWETIPEYSFCLMLCVQSQHKTWAQQFGSDFTMQGALFERLTEESLIAQGWTVATTGWSPGNASKIEEVVNTVAEALFETEINGAIEKWISQHANEEQLDLVCHSPFRDRWGGRPVYLFQCASGANWTKKIHTPDPDTWGRIVAFTTPPQRGFAMPFSLPEDEFRRYAGKIRGLFLDRFRIHSPCSDAEDLAWASSKLRSDIAAWMSPRCAVLPLDV